MLEEILEIVSGKWGLIGLGALVVFSGSGRKVVRAAAKGLIRTGMEVSDGTREFIAELKEQGSDLIAEVKAERQEALSPDSTAQAAKAAAKSASRSESGENNDKKTKKAATQD